MNGKIRSIIRAAKRKDIVWRYVSNLGATLSYAARTNRGLTAAEKGVVDQLNDHGIAIASVDSLVDPLQLNEMYRSVAGLLERKSTETAELMVNAANDAAIGRKTFNLEMLGSEVTFDFRDCFARFALNDSFLKIANAYFRMISRLRYYNVWYTTASGSVARESQLWHFDREDRYILKVFLYLEDVHEGAGPFTYAPGTHKKGEFRSINPEYFLEGGVRRTTDDQMKAVFPENRWIRALGKRGTIIFADTRGFHKGGDARTKDRLMYTCMYTSPASQSKNLIKFDENFDRSALDALHLQALGLN